MTGARTIAAAYQRTAEGLLAARVDDLAYLAVPVAAGLKIATGWRMRQPMSDWTPSLLSGAAGIVPDEGAFRTHVNEIAGHRTELVRLARRRESGTADTPWGAAQCSEVYGAGIVFLTTPSHGGFWLDGDRLAAMPAYLRNEGGWYEEDAEWAKVAAAFPDLFTAYERRHAEMTLRNSYPDEWEAMHGRALEPSESFEKDRRRFYADHTEDWIAVSALRSADHEGMIEVTATQGGRRGDGPVRHFLVPASEYRAGRHGFVIDLRRHEEEFWPA